jgi:hypothetical protein
MKRLMAGAALAAALGGALGLQCRLEPEVRLPGPALTVTQESTAELDSLGRVVAYRAPLREG